MLWVAGATLADPTPRAGAVAVDGARIVGEAAAPPPGAKVLDARGLTIVPAIVDAHVHLCVAGEPPEIARREAEGGVAAVLDLAAPERLLPLRHPPLRVRFAGPMLTAPGGYPTRSWGRTGEGLEVGSPEKAREAVRRLAAAGAAFVKLAFDRRFPLLAPEVARAAGDEAHRLGLRVAAHALDVASVRAALEAGADVLAHTPRDTLPPDLLARMKGKWVISTLHAFGVDPQRLTALAAAGANVAYGTDLGNEDTHPGIDARELALVAAAGLDPLEVATRGAASLLGFADLGRFARGCAASLIAVRTTAPEHLAQPVWGMIDGTMIRPAAGAAP
jgi:imidazolonepropionase-like amidohydrolase